MIFKTRKQARDVLNQQPFTAECRARHIVVPVYERNLIGEIISPKPIGYSYRMRGKNE